MLGIRFGLYIQRFRLIAVLSSSFLHPIAVLLLYKFLDNLQFMLPRIWVWIYILQLLAQE